MKYSSIWRKTLAPNETIRYEFSIGSRYRWFMAIGWVVVSVPLTLFGIGLITIFAAPIYFLAYLPVANAYALTDRRALVHRGWLNTSMISIDYDRITDVAVRDKFFDRLLTKTGSLVINSAGTANAEVVLRNIERPYEIQKKILSMKEYASKPVRRVEEPASDAISKLERLAALRQSGVLSDTEFRQRKDALLRHV